ncbi:MAG: peptide-methionine (R)-S-oxide reductase MsrB [Actinomycetota bacterium]
MSSSGTSKIRSDGAQYPTQIDESSLKEKVDPLSYDVLRNGGTERPFTGEYVDTETVGIYKCKACSAELFRSETKFHSGCGWPSFYAPKDGDAVELIEDRSLFPRVRTEVRCANCGSHLGHVFEGEGYDVPTDQRWCINSVSPYFLNQSSSYLFSSARQQYHATMLL